jgi:hypothetical protein
VADATAVLITTHISLNENENKTWHVRFVLSRIRLHCVTPAYNVGLSTRFWGHFLEALIRILSSDTAMHPLPRRLVEVCSDLSTPYHIYPHPVNAVFNLSMSLRDISHSLRLLSLQKFTIYHSHETLSISRLETMSLPTYLEGLDLSNVDFQNHHSLTKDVVSLNVAFMTLVCLVTALRMSIRLFMIHAAGLDDCT